MGKDGEPVVAIIGGDQKGMEVWNPRTKTVELLWDVIPPEEGGNQGLQVSEMVTIKGGTEFILYGGYHESFQDGIWKYVVANNTWERYFLISTIICLNHLNISYFLGLEVFSLQDMPM